MSEANKKQVGGKHYQGEKIQHWDFAASQEFDYFQGQITKYVTRWKAKNGLQDLEKALHFLEKYIETEKEKFEFQKKDAEKLYSHPRQFNGTEIVKIASSEPQIWPLQTLDKLWGENKDKVNHPSPFGYDPNMEIGRDKV